MKTVIEIIKANFKAYMRQPHAMILVLVLPVLFTFYFGVLGKSTDSLNFEVDKVKIHFDDNSNKIGKDIYTKILESNEGKKIFNIVNKNEAEFKIVLDKDFDENLKNLKQTKVSMTTQNKEGNFSETITKTFLDECAKSITKIYTEQKLLKNKELTPLELEKINKDLNAFRTNILEVKKLSPIKSLSKYETTIPGVLSSMMIFMLIFQGLGSYFKEREDGVFQRKLAMPHSRFSIYVYYFIEVFIFGLVYTGIYLAFVKSLNLAFKSTSILNVILYVILFSLFGALVSSVFLAFTNKNIATILTMIFMYIQMFLSGDLGFKLFDNEMLNNIIKNSPTKIIGEVALSMQTNDSTQEILRRMSPVIATGLIIFIIGFLLTKKTWRNIK